MAELPLIKLSLPSFVSIDYTGKSPYEFASIHPHKAQASKVFSTLVAQYTPIFIGEDNDIKYMMKEGHQVCSLFLPCEKKKVLTIHLFLLCEKGCQTSQA